MNTNLQIIVARPSFNLADDRNDLGGSFREFDESDIVNAAIESISYLHQIGLVE